MMLKKYALLVFVILDSICECFTKFEKDTSFQGTICASIAYNFGQVSRPTFCAILCDRTTDCIGFFHSVDQHTCYGVNTFTLTGCTSNSGYKFYKKDLPPTTTTTTTIATTTTTTPASFPTSCTTNTDCTSVVSNTACILGTCQCSRTFVLDPGTATCVTSCTTYGSTFTSYNNYALFVSSATSYSGISENACMTHCSNTASCRSVNFAASMGNLCTLKTSTERENPGSFTSSSGINHHVRNCA